MGVECFLRPLSMPISSRTPEGESNCCPVCGKDTRTEPSETPTRDAPCPHCGHLLWFAPASEEPVTLPERGSKSYEGTLLKLGRLRFGVIPGKLVHPLTEAVGALAGSRRVRDSADLAFFVDVSNNWTDLTYRLRRMAGLPTRFSWGYAMRDFVHRQFRRLAARRLPKKPA